VEALKHGGIANNVDVKIKWINSENLHEEDLASAFKGVDGILVPGGFGDRGINGKIHAIKYARENSIPFFGICLGMQLAVVEYSRNVVGLIDAHSSEFNENTNHPVIDLMPEQKDVESKGGTMRLGAYPCELSNGTKIQAAYGEQLIYERHRHRYEFNNEYRDILVKNGMVLSGLSPNGRLVETIELPDHPWFIGVQFHPEFKSRPNRPHPLFKDFVNAAIKADKK
jgi:CTP synthase